MAIAMFPCCYVVDGYGWLGRGEGGLLRVVEQDEVNETLHKIRLDGLTPGQTYYYRVCSREVLQNGAWHKVFGHTAQSEFYSFALPEPDTDEFTAVIFNDLHCNKTLYHALLKQIEDVKYDFAIFNGDCVSDPEDRDQATWFVKVLTEGIKGSHVPTLFVRGNQTMLWSM